MEGVEFIPEDQNVLARTFFMGQTYLHLHIYTFTYISLYRLQKHNIDTDLQKTQIGIYFSTVFFFYSIAIKL